jgi:hypothetical protein
MFTVTFLNSNSGQWEVSRHTSTLRVARNWAKWLGQQSFVSETAIYRGPAGGERVE